MNGANGIKKIHEEGEKVKNDEAMPAEGDRELI